MHCLLCHRQKRGHERLWFSRSHLQKQKKWKRYRKPIMLVVIQQPDPPANQRKAHRSSHLSLMSIKVCCIERHGSFQTRCLRQNHTCVFCNQWHLLGDLTNTFSLRHDLLPVSVIMDAVKHKEEIREGEYTHTWERYRLGLTLHTHTHTTEKDIVLVSHYSHTPEKDIVLVSHYTHTHTHTLSYKAAACGCILWSEVGNCSFPVESKGRVHTHTHTHTHTFTHTHTRSHTHTHTHTRTRGACGVKRGTSRCHLWFSVTSSLLVYQPLWAPRVLNTNTLNRIQKRKIAAEIIVTSSQVYV